MAEQKPNPQQQKELAEQKKYPELADFGKQMEALGGAFQGTKTLDNLDKAFPNQNRGHAALDKLMKRLPDKTADNLKKLADNAPDHVKQMRNLMEKGQSELADVSNYEKQRDLLATVNSAVHMSAAAIRRDRGGKEWQEYRGTLEKLNETLVEGKSNEANALKAANVGGTAYYLRHFAQVTTGAEIVKGAGGFDPKERLDPVKEKPLIDNLDKLDKMSGELQKKMLAGKVTVGDVVAVEDQIDATVNSTTRPLYKSQLERAKKLLDPDAAQHQREVHQEQRPQQPNRPNQPRRRGAGRAEGPEESPTIFTDSELPSDVMNAARDAVHPMAVAHAGEKFSDKLSTPAPEPSAGKSTTR